MENTLQRLNFIDFMKGICILTVVVRHIYPQLFPGQLGVIIYAVQVPVFFYLSGVLDSKKSNSIKNSIYKNVDRIFIPYLFWSFIGIAIFLPFEYYSFTADRNGDILSYSSLKVFILTPNKHLITNYPCWFLLALFEIKIISLVIDNLSRKLKFNPIIEYVMIALLVIIIYYLCLSNIKFPLSITSAIVNIPFFYFGRLTRNHIFRPVSVKYKILFITMSIASCILLYYYMTTYDSNNCILPSNILKTYILISIGIIVTYTISITIHNFTIINFIGVNSMIILVTHVILINFLPAILPSHILLISTLFLSLILIPICKKTIPVFVGEKNMFNNK